MRRMAVRLSSAIRTLSMTCCEPTTRSRLMIWGDGAAVARLGGPAELGRGGVGGQRVHRARRLGAGLTPAPGHDSLPHPRRRVAPGARARMPLPAHPAAPA